MRHSWSFRHRAKNSKEQALLIEADGSSCECGADHTPGLEFSRLSRPVYIVYRDGTQSLGSVELRGLQAATSLANVGYGGTIHVQSLESVYRDKPTGAIIIALKTAIKDRFDFALRDLAKNNTLLFDIVDGSISGEMEALAEGFLCASVSEFTARKQTGARSYLVHHAIDTRIDWPPSTPRSAFSVAYYGAASNGLHIGEIPEIHVVAYRERVHQEAGEELSETMSTLASYSHHYAVRQWNPRDGYKPLTKAFMAAWCNAVVIASRDDPESLALLGENYPYLARSSAQRDVIGILTFARETLGGTEWADAQKVMEQLKTLSCPTGSAMSLAKALAEYQD